MVGRIVRLVRTLLECGPGGDGRKELLHGLEVVFVDVVKGTCEYITGINPINLPGTQRNGVVGRLGGLLLTCDDTVFEFVDPCSSRADPESNGTVATVPTQRTQTVRTLVWLGEPVFRKSSNSSHSWTVEDRSDLHSRHTPKWFDDISVPRRRRLDGDGSVGVPVIRGVPPTVLFLLLLLHCFPSVVVVSRPIIWSW